MAELPALAGLFLSALLAATVVPAQSEAVFVGLLYLGRTEPLVLLAVASVGNTLGSVVNWGLGRAVNRYRSRRWFLCRSASWTRPNDGLHDTAPLRCS